jgi:2-hydroxychromene-2-carboxylate isomerase
VELDRDKAIYAVTASAKRLFPIVSEQQARDLAALVLRDLEAQGIRLVQELLEAG